MRSPRFRMIAMAIPPLACLAIAAACSSDPSAPLVAEEGGANDAASPIDVAAHDARREAADPCAKVDLQTDFSNCGRCGHTCGDGECKAGVCQAFLLASPVSAPRELVAWAGTLYYSTANGDLVAQPIGDETSRLLATGQGDVRRIATDGISLYWISAGSIQRCALGGCGLAPSIVASGTDLRDVSWDAAHLRLVWADHGAPCGAPNAPSLLGTSLADGGDARALVADAGTYPSHVAATPGAIYWTLDRCGAPAPGTLFALASSGVTTLRDDPSADAIVDLAANDAGAVLAVEHGGGFATPGGALAMEGALRIAVDDTFVYWTRRAASGFELAWRRRASGAGASEGAVPFTGVDPTGALALTPSFVYFASGGSISGVAKP